MNLIPFKNNIERELELSILNKGKTPILDRLEIHLKDLDQSYNLATMLNPQNIKSELYLSMLYQIVYPAKKKVKFNIIYNGSFIRGKSSRDKIQNLVKEVGVENIKKLKTYSRFLYKKDIEEVVGNAYKVIDGIHSFDTSFGGTGATASASYFIKELVTELNLKVEVKNEETFSYN